MYRTAIKELELRLSRAHETIGVTKLVAEQEPATKQSAARLISVVEQEIADLEREIGALRVRHAE